MPTTSPPSGARTTAMGAAVCTVAVLPVFLTGALAVQVRADLGFDEGGIGLTVAAFFGAAATASTVAGRVAERLGPAVAMRLGTAVAAASLLATAVLASSLGVLLACLALGGLGNAIAQPSTNLLLARRMDRTRLGLAFGIKQSAVPASTLLGGLAVPAIALTVGWRYAFAAGGLAAAGLVVGGPRADGDERGIAPARRGGTDTALRPLVVLSLGIGLGAAAAGTLGSFLVSAAVDAGIGEGRAGLLAAACSAAGITTRVAVGRRADRRGGRHLATVAVMLAVGSLGYLCLATARPALVVLGAVAGYTLAWGWPGLFNLAIVRNNPGAPGAATGITQTGTYAGAVLGPLLFGFGVERWSYDLAWIVTAGVSVLAAVVITVGRALLRADQGRRRATQELVPPL